MRKHAFNLIFLSVLAILLFQRAPVIFKMYQAQGQSAPAASVWDFNHQEVALPMQKNLLLVFWATWCGPCKVELARINKLIKDGKLSAESVLAVSVSEELELVRQHVQEKDYKFQVALDPNGLAARAYGVAGTPTMVLINESNRIEWLTMGLSPTLELRLLSFF